MHAGNQAAQLEALRRDIRAGIEQADRGDLTDGNDLFDELLKRTTSKPATQCGPAAHGGSSNVAMVLTPLRSQLAR